MARFLKLLLSFILMLLTLAAAIVLIWKWTSLFWPSNSRPTLSFTENGTFQISIFSDPYDGKGKVHVLGQKESRHTQRMMNTVLELEHPQLAVLNGDIIVRDLNITENMKKTVQPLLKHNTPWASIYVDHESDLNASRHHVLDQEQQWKNSLTRQDVNASTAGVSNYWFPVFANETKGAETPLLLLWFFDSRGGYHYNKLDHNGHKIRYPNWVDETVIAWFQKTKQERRNEYGTDVPSLAFVHAPISAVAALQADSGVQTGHPPGDDHNGLIESRKDGHENAFTAALLDTPKLIGVFSGSQDGNSGCFKQDRRLTGTTLEGKGLNLCAGGSPDQEMYGDLARGSRQLLITMKGLEHERVRTWVTLEFGLQVEEGQLNRTVEGN